MLPPGTSSVRAWNVEGLQGAVLEPPAVEGLVRDLQPFAGLRDRQAFPLELLRLPQLGDDLLHREPLSRHQPPPFELSFRRSTTNEMDQMKGGRTLGLTPMASFGQGWCWLAIP